MTPAVRLLLFYVVLLIAALVVAAKSFALAKEDERLVVIRRGKLLGVYGPGLSIVLPFIDRVVRVKVETIAGWRGLSEGELRKRAAEVATKQGL
jgi:regulator of protease activity HflC (stomatin/prohibitin superfamily)